jgi:uncharacterized membrane protein
MWILILCALLALASWMIAIYYWGKLPQTIPTHFGFSGQVDGWGQKSVWFTFMIPALQTLMTAGFVFLYFKPQYTNVPSTMLLMTITKSKRKKAFTMIRNMLVITLLFTGLFFTYLTFGTNYSALHTSTGLLPQVIIIWLAALFAWLIWYNIKVYRITKKLVTSSIK